MIQGVDHSRWRERCPSTEHDALSTSVEDDKVLEENRGALRLAVHRLPCADDAALEVFAE